MSGVPAPLRIGLVGFGTVGRAVARILCDRRHPGLRLAGVCTRRAERSRAETPWIPADVIWTDDFDTLLAADPAVIVEVIVGIEPARTWIIRALSAGCSVVTANKQVVAEHGPALVATARACGRSLRFEATVGGAIPVIRGVQDGLGGDRLTRIVGVVNGTCNFVLTRIARSGVSLAEAVSEAQARGLAEADPAADLDGLDARAKLSILATLGFGEYLAPRDIPAESIRAIDSGDMAAAASLGRVVRQVAWASRSDDGTDGISARVGAALLPACSWLARADGAENVVMVHGECSGTTVFAGQGAGGNATAVAVLADLLAIGDARGVPPVWRERASAPARSDFRAAHYVRVCSGGGEPAGRATARLSAAGISTQRVLEDAAADGRHRFAALVHACSHRDLTQALVALVPAFGAGTGAVGLPLLDAD